MLHRIRTLSSACYDVTTAIQSASSVALSIHSRPRITQWSSPHSQCATKQYRQSGSKSQLSSNDLTSTSPDSTSTTRTADNPTTSPSREAQTPRTPPPPPQPTQPLPDLPRPDPNAPHNSLTTFLSYAARTNLSPSSTTYHGTLYEYLTQSHLQQRLGFTLTRVGGRGDSGIDLLGTWALPAILQAHRSSSSSSSPNPNISDTQPTTPEPSPTNPTRTLIQCKRLTRAAGPNLIRELEGTFRGAPTGWRSDNVLGMLVCTRAATKGIRDAMGRSARGLVWMMLEETPQPQPQRQSATRTQSEISRRVSDGDQHNTKPDGETEHYKSEDLYPIPRVRIRQFLYNAAAASKCGLEGVNVGIKYDANGDQTEVQLLWQGRPIQFLDS